MASPSCVAYIVQGILKYISRSVPLVPNIGNNLAQPPPHSFCPPYLRFVTTFFYRRRASSRSGAQDPDCRGIRGGDGKPRWAFVHTASILLLSMSQRVYRKKRDHTYCLRITPVFFLFHVSSSTKVGKVANPRFVLASCAYSASCLSSVKKDSVRHSTSRVHAQSSPD